MPLLNETLPVTDWVSKDEWAYSLYETNEPAPDSRSVRRYRHILVVRGDELADHVTDLGLASTFYQEFNILGGVPDGDKFHHEHTVGELLEMAHQLRAQKYDMSSIRPRDVIGDYRDNVERMRNIRAGRSIVGKPKGRR